MPRQPLSHMEKIGLFGGTFDPPHNGHIHIARAFADELGLDTVVFLPAGDPYHKEGTRTPAAHRLEMTRLAAAADTRFAVSDCDIVRTGATYTFDTVQIFRQQFPAAQLWWLLGSDSLLKLHTWKKWQTLVGQIRIAAAARAGDNLARAPSELQEWMGRALQDGSLKLLNAPQYDTSSTEIRRLIRSGSPADAWLDSRVAYYINRHNLYR